MLNFQLSDTQKEIRAHARQFALEEVLPKAWQYDEKDQTPMDVLEKAFHAGVMNSDIPKDFGGRGYGLLEGALITEEISAACPGIATSIFDNSLGMEPIILSKNEGAKQKYLTDIATHFKLICFATSEAFMGSDVSGIRCRAKQDGDDYILNGTKFWITNGGIADYMTIFATVDPEKSMTGSAPLWLKKTGKGCLWGNPSRKWGSAAPTRLLCPFTMSGCRPAT